MPSAAPSAPHPSLAPGRPTAPALCPHSLIFGAITCFTGFLGVVTGAGATRWCRLRTQRADPLVCAVGMLGSAIFVCLIFVAAKSSIVGAYVSVTGVRRWWGERAPSPRGGGWGLKSAACPAPSGACPGHRHALGSSWTLSTALSLRNFSC